MSVLIFSRSDNFHADEVEKNLLSRGKNYYRINVDVLQRGKNKFYIDKNYKPVLADAGQLTGVKSVFVHHPTLNQEIIVAQDDLDKKLVKNSWENTIENIEICLESAFWVNSLSLSRQITNIFYQQKTAIGLGFKVPKTIFTNDIDILKGFCNENSKTVIKPGNLKGVSMNGKRILSHLIDPKKIDFSNLNESPCFFQEYIDKKYELRVHVVGQKTLTCRIESQKSEKAKYDWRNYDIENTPHHEHNLDEDINSLCLKLTKSLGLKMGVIDIICTPGGEYYFLECNTNGYWAWIEGLTGLKITDMVCDYLCDPY